MLNPLFQPLNAFCCIFGVIISTEKLKYFRCFFDIFIFCFGHILQPVRIFLFSMTFFNNNIFNYTSVAVLRPFHTYSVCGTGAARAIVLSHMLRLQCATDPRLYHKHIYSLFVFHIQKLSATFILFNSRCKTCSIVVVSMDGEVTVNTVTHHCDTSI